MITDWLRRILHVCLPPHAPTEGAIFTCHKCGARWEAVYEEEIIEVTIMFPVDIGEWHWRKVDD